VIIAAVAILGIAALALPPATDGVQDTRVRPVTDPTQLPRLTFEQLQYTGAFRLPSTEAGDSFSFGGGPMAFNPNRGSLFVGTRSGRVAEVTVPTPVVTTDIAALPFAEYLQPFSEPTEGHIKQVADDGVSLSGLLVHGDRLYGTAVIYYDANNTQALSHFSRPLTLSQKGASPMKRVGQRGRTGFVAGYMAAVPPEWQTKLGGPAVTGQCCLPIVSRTSWGPSAFVWNPSEVDAKAEASANPLVYYDNEHQTLGPWDGSNPTFGGTIQMGGLALIGGTSTALFVGRNGTGPFCYGIGTDKQSLAGTVGPDGEKYCYDPVYESKAQHAYPYRYQMWAYDLNDWAAVRAGRRDPWEVKPYGVWPFELPFPEPNTRIAGVAYDAASRRLFVSQYEADRDGYSYRSLVHVYRIP
jgi:hypothetical protein